MKLLTLNLHSYLDDNWQNKLKVFTDFIIRELPDVVALQEVNQPLESDMYFFDGRLNIKEFGLPLRENNYGIKILEILRGESLNYYYVWLGIKESYGRFEEGLGFLIKGAPEDFSVIQMSNTQSKDNWKKRMALGVYFKGILFCNVHMGRWDDEEEPFKTHWQNLEEKLTDNGKIFLMGDFNSPVSTPSQGYDCVISSGWKDTYELALNKDEGHTVGGIIDGWRDCKNDFTKERIDYIFTNYSCKVQSSYTVFNGKSEEIISDHFGVFAKVKE